MLLQYLQSRYPWRTDSSYTRTMLAIAVHHFFECFLAWIQFFIGDF